MCNCARVWGEEKRVFAFDVLRFFRRGHKLELFLRGIETYNWEVIR